MATTKETMKVIAGGVNKKEEPEVIMDGRVIAVEMSDELAEVFEGLVGALISKCEDEDAERSENNRNNMEPEDDGYFMKVEELAAEYDVPVIRLETDYQQQDVEQLRIRLEAFAEMLRVRNQERVRIAQ